MLRITKSPKKSNTERGDFLSRFLVPPNTISGFSLSENNHHAAHDAFFHCLLKGLLVFSASYGVVSGMLSEFSIEYNQFLVCILLFFSSMALTLLHLNKFLFNLGYPVLFVIYAYELIVWRMYANSGFQAFVNIVNESYSSHFLLNFSKEYQEIITDRYTTITCTAIFIGIFIAILVNVGIFNNMHFVLVVMLTFVPLQLGVFIGNYPSPLSLAFVFFSYFAVYFLKHSGHYHFVYPDVHSSYEFTFTQKKKDYVYHKSSAGNMLHLGLFALIVSIFFTFFASIGIKTSKEQAVHSGEFKKQLDEYAMILTQNGIMGLFDRYASKGGVSSGKLGGVRSVRPDYQTDLEATFVPYAFETIYLKGFVGYFYDFDEWLEASTEQNYETEDYRYINESQTISWDNSLSKTKDPETLKTSYHGLTTYEEQQNLELLMNLGYTPPMAATFQIKNIDANTDYSYVPYYIDSPPSNGHVTDANIIQSTSPLGETSKVLCTPYSSTYYNLLEHNTNLFEENYLEEEKLAFQIYQDEVNKNYLQIPSSIYEELASYHDEIGTGENLAEQVKLIQRYFVQNYEYSMAPGATPFNEDFVTYFLGKQKRGYCAHFASAAALLLRSYGYPARYVEGYVITPSEMADAELADESYDVFFQGENPLGATDVIKVDISDGNAHAWVEVYNENFGWIPVEFTPPSKERDEPTYGDFLSTLSNLFRGNSISESTNELDNNTETAEHNDLFSSLKLGNSFVIYIFVAILLILMLIPGLVNIYRYYVNYRKRRLDYRNGRFKSSISFEFSRLSEKLKKKYKDERFVLPEDLSEFYEKAIKAQDLLSEKGKNQISELKQKYGMTISDLMTIMQKCLYSSEAITKEEADQIIQYLKSLKTIS